MIYVSLFVALIVLRFVLANQATLRDQLYPVVMAGLFIFVAFRLEVGCDWNGYQRNFLVQLDLDLADALKRREPLWWAVVQVTGKIGLGYPWLNVGSAAIFFAGVHALARRQPDRLGFVILLFPVLMINIAMSGLRQAAAIGLLCFAFAAFNRGKALLFTVYTLLATGFHASAGVFLLLTPLAGAEWVKSRVFAVLLLAGPGIMLLATSESGQLAVSRYVNTGVDAQGALYRAGLLFLSGMFFLLLLRRPWNDQSASDYRLANLGALMMLATLPLVFVSSVIADRFGYYLIPIQTIILARVPFLNLGANTAFLSAFPYALLLLVLAVWSVQSGHFHYCYLPYGNWVFGLPDLYRNPL